MRFTIAVLACMVWPMAPLHAQVSVPRNDAAISIGWSGSDYPLRSYDNWQGSLSLSLATGHYWTDYLKTDIEAAWSSPAHEERYEPADTDRRYFTLSTYRWQDSRLGIGQSYQFGRNQWVHPYLGAGADFVWRRSAVDRATQSRDDPSATRPSTPIGDAARREADSRVLVRPFVRGGLKMYASERMFFGTELKLGFASDLDHAVWKVALGFDF